MYLIAEAIAMLRSGRILVGWGEDRVTVRSSRQGGFVITHYVNGVFDRREKVRSPRTALRRFRDAVGRPGMVAALDAHRYPFLFPNGSSLDWAGERRMRAAS